MNCDEEALTEYLDGELKPERRAAVEAHLSGCASCSKTLARLEAASAAYRKHGAVPAAAGLADSVRAPAPPVRQTQGRTPLWELAGAGLSLCGVMLVLGKLAKPTISGVLNQTMGMISGAASTVGSGDGGGPPQGGGSDGLLLALALVCGLTLVLLGVRAYRRRR